MYYSLQLQQQSNSAREPNFEWPPRLKNYPSSLSLKIKPPKSEYAMSAVKIDMSGGICTVTLNRPEQRNALNVPMLKQLNEVIQGASTDTSVRCLVITGSGRGFCAGADLAEWADAEANGTLESYGWTESAHLLMQSIVSFPKPSVAVVNGAAVGAGLDMALSCDFRLAVDSAKFIAGYTSMAYTPDAGGSWLLPRLIGVEAAKQFLFFDQPWTAQLAKSKGMVNESIAADDFEAETQKFIAQLASGPTFAHAKTKRLLQASGQNSFSQQLELEHQAGLECGRSEDANEALQASIEKRPANFCGR